MSDETTTPKPVTDPTDDEQEALRLAVVAWDYWKLYKYDIAEPKLGDTYVREMAMALRVAASLRAQLAEAERPKYDVIACPSPEHERLVDQLVDARRQLAEVTAERDKYRAQAWNRHEEIVGLTEARDLYANHLDEGWRLANKRTEELVAAEERADRLDVALRAALRDLSARPREG